MTGLPMSSAARERWDPAAADVAERMPTAGLVLANREKVPLGTARERIQGAMAENQNLVDAMALAEEIADKAVRAHQDWPAIERMADELASRARELAATAGQAQRPRD